MLAIATRALLTGSIAPIAQRVESGTQYYRLHPAVTALATHKLSARLQAYCSHPWAQRPK